VSDALRLLAGVALPWIAGYATIRAVLARSGDSNAWVEAGYGHFAGVLLLTLLLRAQNVIGMPLAVLPTAAGLMVIAVAAGYLAWRWRSPRIVGPAPFEPPALRWLAYVALALLACRVATLGVDVVLRPLFAWDAWSQWGTKARVWSSLREIAPFIGYDEWLARNRAGYTDTAPNYPATIPLLQAWMALVLGRWDDALINLPWLAAFVALGAGLYGQLRRLGAGFAWATIGTWLALSLPLVDTHVALAGYADLHVAAAYALALLALVQWEANRNRTALTLLAVTAVLLPLLKLPGIAWFGTLALGAAIALVGRTPLRAIALAAIVLVATVAVGYWYGSGKVTPDAAATQYRIVESLLQHLLAFGNWHLLWYLAPLSFAFAWRQALAQRGTSIALACGFGFLAWTFFFTQAGDWVVDYTTVNRALLHIAPATAAFAALLVQRWMAARGPARRDDTVEVAVADANAAAGS
jgi:hypothetical protein